MLLVLYECLFRLYQQHLLYADNYGTIAVFALMILLFLYYLAFILLLGAEVNSWAAGQRATAADLPGMCTLYRLTARYVEQRGRLGMAHEEMQRHSQSRAVRYAEAVLDARSAYDSLVTAARLDSRTGTWHPLLATATTWAIAEQHSAYRAHRLVVVAQAASRLPAAGGWTSG